MSWRVLIAAAVVTAAVDLPALTRADAQQFRTGIDVVRLPVMVTSRSGLPIRGLKAEDFEVREEGQPQKVTYFTEGATGDAVPLHLGLLLDTSGSMEADLRQATDAAVRFVRAVEEARDTTFVEFDTNVQLSRFEASSYPTLFERIRSRKAKGYTALYDALGVYVDSTLRRDGQHVLVMYTDGGDTMSRMNYSQLEMLLRQGNVVVYALGYLENQLSSQRFAQQNRLTQIAKETGGEAFFPSTREEVSRAYERIRDDILFRYTLGFVPSAATEGGKFRKVEVRLLRKDHAGAKIRTRSGYITRGTGSSFVF